MVYTLHLADPGYSSWSMRVWLVFDRFGIRHRIAWHEIYGTPPLREQLATPPARTVPLLVSPDGTAIRDSLAIVEELASRHPELAIWPRHGAMRALARSLAAEMHSGFSSLRAACPMCLRVAFDSGPPDAGADADLARLEEIWTDALHRSGGPWLAGNWSAADAFFAPVVARIAGYRLSLKRKETADYADRILTDDGMLRWRKWGLEIGSDLHDSVYANPFPRAPWPTRVNRS